MAPAANGFIFRFPWVEMRRLPLREAFVRRALSFSDVTQSQKLQIVAVTNGERQPSNGRSLSNRVSQAAYVPGGGTIAEPVGFHARKPDLKPAARTGRRHRAMVGRNRSRPTCRDANSTRTLPIPRRVRRGGRVCHGHHRLRSGDCPIWAGRLPTAPPCAVPGWSLRAAYCHPA